MLVVDSIFMLVMTAGVTAEPPPPADPHTILKCADGVDALAISKDGNLLAVGHGDEKNQGTVILWDLQSKKQRPLVLKPVAQVGGLAFSPDRKLLAGAAFDDTLRIWGVETGKELGLVKDIEKLVAVDFPSPDCIVTRGAGKPPAFWDVSKIRVPVLQKQQPDLGKRCDLHAFSTDGKRLATVTFEAGGRSARGTVKIWGAPEWNEIRELERTKGQPMTLAFSKDGKTLALGSAFGPDDPIQLWDVETGKTIATFADQVPHTLAFSPDGKYLAGGDYGGGLLLWDLTKKEKVMSMAAHTKAIVGLLFTPDGRHLISGSYDSTVQVWDFAKLLKKSP